MPKHRKRRIMLSIVSIVLFVVLSAQLSTVSFSVTAAGEHGELVAEEYERYRERFDRIEKIGDLENQGFRLLEDQIFAMPLQKLPEPGGKPMDALAQQSPGGKYTLPRVHVEGAELDMSFSGLKTAVVNLAHNAQQKGEPLDAAALARDFTQAVSDELVPRAMEAARRTGRRTIVAAGGVAANSIIRGDLERACRQAGCRLYLPPLRLCGDNGAMIGAQGYYEYLAGHTADLSLNAYATRDLDRG